MENEVLKVIDRRTSLRDYDETPLTKEEEDAIIHAAMRAPTAGNQMLYSMIIIRDKAKQDRLSELCDNQAFIRRAKFLVVFVADQHRWFDYYRQNDVEKFCNETDKHYAPAGLGDLVLAFQDTMAAAQNAVIAAESIGVGSCYIGDVIENYEEVKKLLNLPEETYPLAMLCFGHYRPGVNINPRDRFKREYVVFEDEYRQLTEEEYSDMFAERAKQGYRSNNTYGAENFAQQFYSRKMAAPFRHEMNRSVRRGLEDWDK